MNNEIRDKMRNIVEKAKKDKDILALALFGSSLKGKGRDIDLCLYLKRKMTNREMSRKKIEFSGRAKNDVDIQIFQQLPMYIRIRVVREGMILFCKDEGLLYEIAFRTIKEFNLYEKVYEMYLERVKNG